MRLPLRLTPPRLDALLVLGAVGLVALSVVGPVDVLGWSDPLDSVDVLSEHRACTLARQQTASEDELPCQVITLNTSYGEVRLGRPDEVPLKVCFLRAAQWFVVDFAKESPCPTGPPESMGRVRSFQDERSVEQKWSDTIKRRRDMAELDWLRTRLLALITDSRAEVPLTCPETMASSEVQAFDVDLLTLAHRPWHFLTSDRIEALFTGGSQWQLGEVLGELRRRSPVVLLVEATVKDLPHAQRVGRLEARLTLVDWTRNTTLCQRPVVVQQPENAPRDLSAGDVLMPEFKQRTDTALSDAVREMSGGQLDFVHTW